MVARPVETPLPFMTSPAPLTPEIVDARVWARISHLKMFGLFVGGGSGHEYLFVGSGAYFDQRNDQSLGSATVSTCPSTNATLIFRPCRAMQTRPIIRPEVVSPRTRLSDAQSVALGKVS